MTRRRLALSIVLGVLLGFFAGVAAVSLRHDSLPTSDAGAAKAPALSTATAGFGKLQAAKHPACHSTTCVVVFIRPGFVGMHGCECPSVFQMQVALKAAGARPKSAKATGFYGTATRDQVKAFQRKHGIRATGRYGLPTHKALSRFYTQAQRGRLQQVAHSRQVTKYRSAIVHAAAVAWSHRSSMRYSQSASRGLLPSLPRVPSATDCSGYATWLYKVSGLLPSGLSFHLPDPNGFNYGIVGYTGTLALHGHRISANGRLFPGDLVFYGGGYPFGHVAVVVDGFRRLVSSHGSPGIKVVPFNYRPVSVIRRYF